MSELDDLFDRYDPFDEDEDGPALVRRRRLVRCRRCGKHGRWGVVPTNKGGGAWRILDLQTREPHDCRTAAEDEFEALP